MAAGLVASLMRTIAQRIADIALWISDVLPFHSAIRNPQYAIPLVSSDAKWWSWVVFSYRPAPLAAVRNLGLIRNPRFRVSWVPLTILAVSLLADAARAEMSEPQEHLVSKTVTGTVVWAGKRAISVEFARTASKSEEMLIPIDDKTKVDRLLKSVSELKPGDTVRVGYQQTYKERDDGSEFLAATVATNISLVRSDAPEGTLRSSEAATRE